MDYTTAMSFSRLNALGLITDAQQDAATAHSQHQAIGATASPAECLCGWSKNGSHRTLS